MIEQEGCEEAFEAELVGVVLLEQAMIRIE
jgi:hypothetical protein